MPGEIFLAMVEPAPPGAPAGATRLNLAGQDLLVNLDLALQPGERVLAEVLPRPPDEASPLLRILARSGEPGGKLEIPAQGLLRLAPGEDIPPALRVLLASAKGLLAGEILPFENRAAAGVRLGGAELRFQLDPSAQPGDRLFVRSRDAGGALTLQVLARGGPGAGTPQTEGSTATLLRMGPLRPPAASSPPQQALSPGNILTGTLVRVSPEIPPSGAGGSAALFHGKPEGRMPPAGQAPQAGGRVEAQPAAPSRWAVLRFPGFEMEVPWPEAASAAFAPGDPVRLWVRGVSPRLDVELLPPAHGGEGGTRWAGARWVPSGGAGERGFGPHLLELAESLAELQKDPREEPALSREAARLQGALEKLILREKELTPERVREAIETSLRESARRELEPGTRAPGEGASQRGSTLRESLLRFLAAAREIGRNDLANLGAGAGRAATSMEFLGAANALRQHTDQGAFLQIPYVLGGERGTMDVVVRGDREASGKGRERENYSAVLLLELEGLGPLRVDAALVRNRASVRFTTPSEPVGKFLHGELPKLREAIESQEIGVERVSWTQGKVTPEPAVPAPPQAHEGPEGAAPFIDLKV